MASGTVEFSAQVPAEDYNRFLEVFGSPDDRRRAMYGASAWFIRNSLRVFLDEVENDPTLIMKLRRAVHRMVEESRAVD